MGIGQFFIIFRAKLRTKNFARSNSWSFKYKVNKYPTGCRNIRNKKSKLKASFYFLHSEKVKLLRSMGGENITLTI